MTQTIEEKKVRLSNRTLLYACLTSLETQTIPEFMNPAKATRLPGHGKMVDGKYQREKSGGVYIRVDGDLLTWIERVLSEQAIKGNVDPDAHARSVEFLWALTAEAAEFGIYPSPELPSDYRLPQAARIPKFLTEW